MPALLLLLVLLLLEALLLEALLLEALLLEALLPQLVVWEPALSPYPSLLPLRQVYARALPPYVWCLLQRGVGLQQLARPRSPAAAAASPSCSAPATTAVGTAPSAALWTAVLVAAASPARRFLRGSGRCESCSTMSCSALTSCMSAIGRPALTCSAAACIILSAT